MSTYVTDSGWCLDSLGSGKSAWHRRVTKGAASLLVRVYSVKPGVYGLKAYLTLGDVPGMPQGGKVLQRHFDAASLQDAKAAALLMLWDIGIALEDLGQALTLPQSQTAGARP